MVGTTPVLSARSFLFVVQVLFVACEDRVAYWWYFRHHQLALSVGNKRVKSYYRFPEKSRMVLTRTMATTNDIQEEEPPTTALEKQVKTLAAAVERLTRQNRDLEEQLRQKNATPDNQGADQEGTSADRRNQEGP